MQLKKVFLVIVMMFLLSMIGANSGLAQEIHPANLQLVPALFARIPVDDVAVLVVDVFEQNQSAKPIPVKTLSGKTCAISMVGQDGMAIRGNATSSLFPLKHPHGNLVFQHLKNMLQNEHSGSIISTFSMTNAPDAELWQTPSGNVWLVGVDTQDYDIDVITSQVNATIDLLHTQEGINRFVINMSFGLAPCENMPSLSDEDYNDQLKKWGIYPPYDGSPLGQLATELDKLDSSADPLGDLIALQNSNPSYSQAFAFLHLVVMQTKIKNALTIVPNPNTLGADLPTFNNFSNPDPNVTIVQVASAGNDGLDYPYYPAYAQNVLSVSAAYSPYACPPGSRADIYTYLNGDLGYPGIAVDQIIHNVLSPISNDGEILESGVSTLAPIDYMRAYIQAADALGCLNGTSFSAPRMALEMAFDQASGNGAKCLIGGGATLSDPPLAHAKWDNLEVPIAASTYCPGFPR